MGLYDRISRQLSHPSGLGGRVVARLMNRGNQQMNARALEHLQVADGQRVLDLGFGGGLTLGPLLDRGAQVTGLDRAADMVEAARNAHPEAVEAGSLEVVRGEMPSLPFPAESFDRVLTVNTVYFWPDLPAALKEVRRVLAPGGRLVIGIRDSAVMQKVSRDIFTVRPPEEVRATVASAGFEDVRLESPSDQKVHFVLALRGSA